LEENKMKKFLSILLVAIMALSLVACGKTEEPANQGNANTTTEPATTTTTEPAATEPEGIVVNGETIDEHQEINVTLSDEPGTLDEFHNSVAATGTVLANLFTPLVRNMSGVLEGDGAESWEVSEDGLTWTFHLRDNYWQDGTKVTAQDYVYSAQMKLKPETAFPYAGNWYVLKNAEAINNGEMDASELGVTAPDEKTVVIETEYVAPALLNSITFYPQKQDHYEKYGDKYGTEADTMLSCGPFIITDRTHNSSITLEKNDKYWDAEHVYLDKVTLYSIQEQTTAYNMLENGSIDYLGVTDQDYIERFQNMEGLHNTKVEYARTFMWFFNLKDKYFSNPKIRKAIAVAFDRDATVDVLLGGVPRKAAGLYAYVMYEGDYNIREYNGDLIQKLIDENPDAAALLQEGLDEVEPGLKAADWSFKVGFGSTGSSMHQQAEYWQDDLIKKLGVKAIETSFDDYAMAMDGWQTGDFQVACLSWGSNADTAYMLNLFTTGSNAIPCHYDNEEFDALVNKLNKTVDPEERIKLVAEGEKEVVYDQTLVSPISYNCGNIFEYDYVRGVDRTPFGNSGFKTIYTVGRP
jgi:oligopeptide transport system substrate-binding protein